MLHRVEMWRTVRWIGIALLLVAALYLLVLQPLERFIGGTSSRLEKGLDRVLGAITNSNTRIVEGRAEIVETTEISELSLLEMKMSATRAFENEGYLLKYLPSGTKKLIVRGHYQVKAGYRLKPGISLRLEKGQPIAKFPKPDVLSVELTDFEILNEEDGWLNKITAEDRATVLRELREQMRQEAIKSGILDTASASLKTRLRDLLGVESVKIEEELP
jgi:Protein of unknown function (DUF4230)